MMMTTKTQNEFEIRNFQRIHKFRQTHNICRIFLENLNLRWRRRENRKLSSKSLSNHNLWAFIFSIASNNDTSFSFHFHVLNFSLCCCLVKERLTAEWGVRYHASVLLPHIQLDGKLNFCWRITLSASTSITRIAPDFSPSYPVHRL